MKTLMERGGPPPRPQGPKALIAYLYRQALDEDTEYWRWMADNRDLWTRNDVVRSYIKSIRGWRRRQQEGGE